MLMSFRLKHQEVMVNLIHSLKENRYELGIGLGVYDIHSPRVPSKDENVTTTS